MIKREERLNVARWNIFNKKQLFLHTLITHFPLPYLKGGERCFNV